MPAIALTGSVEITRTDLVDSSGQSYRPRLRAMTCFWISVVPPKIDWARLSVQPRLMLMWPGSAGP